MNTKIEWSLFVKCKNDACELNLKNLVAFAKKNSFLLLPDGNLFRNSTHFEKNATELF